MRGRGGVDDERAAVTDIGQMAEQFQRIDQFHPGVIATLEAHGEHRARAVRQVFLRPVVVFRRFQAGIRNPFHRRMTLQIFRDLQRVLAVPFHAQGQRFQAQQGVERVLRLLTSAQVPQADGDGMEGVGHRAECLAEVEAIVFRRGLAERGVFVAGHPVEIPGIDHDAADGRAIPAHEFGGRGAEDIRAMLDGPPQGRGRHGVVDDQRDARILRHRRNRLDIRDDAARIGQRFAPDGAGIGVDGVLDRVGIVHVDELHFPAEPLDRLSELIDRAAIELVGGDDVLARSHQREQRHDLRRVARCGGNCAHAALQRGDAFLQNGGGGVRQAGIDVADFLKAEQPGRMGRVVEDEAGRLVDRRLACAGGGVGGRARVDHAGFKTKGGVVAHRRNLRVG